MKLRVALSLFLAGLLMASLAAAQDSLSQAAQKKEPLTFVKVAADIARNLQSQSLNGYLGIYIDPQAWPSGLKDSDLGPFLKVKEAKPDRSAACLFSTDKDAAICVYFDGDTAFGVAAVKAGASGKIEPGDVSAAYRAVSKDMLKKGEPELRFEPGDAATDDGQPLPAFVVSTAAKASG